MFNHSKINKIYILNIILSTLFAFKVFCLPPVPANKPNIHLTDKPSATGPVVSTHTVIPNLHFTMDGRIGVNPQPYQGKFEFALMLPEKIDRHILEANNGPALSQTTSWSTLDMRANGALFSGEYYDHVTLCDATQMDQSKAEFNFSNNPKICGAFPDQDCYDFNLIFSVGLSNGNRQLRSLPVRLRVKNPKTTNAKIDAVWATGAMVRGSTFSNINKFMELNTVGKDKKLLVMRTLDSRISWRNTNTNIVKTQKRDMVYSTYGNRKNPCDVTGWREIHPITHAPHDERVNSKYGFAKMPFKDAIGNQIPDGAEIFGSYQWLDRDAKNLFFASNNVRFTNFVDGKVETAFDYECVKDGCRANSEEDVASFEERGRGKTYAVMGLWTNGKTVTLDNMFNASDFALGFLPKYQIRLFLYENDPGKTNGKVRIGGQRQNSRGDTQVPGLVRNATFFGSYENSFNFNSNFLPRTPADVVWQMSSSNMSDEVAFDDFMNNDILISSPMNAASSLGGRNRRKFYDGRQFVADELDPDLNKKFIQNVSSSLDLKPPKFGELQGNIRIEPVALGGIKGKGLYLEGSEEAKIKYEIPNQEININDQIWTYSIFLDPRFNSDSTKLRNLVEFSNGSKIQIVGPKKLRIKISSKLKYEYELPNRLSLSERKWHHLSFKFFPRLFDSNPSTPKYAQELIIYINGFPIHSRSLRFNKDISLGSPTGTLYVGRNLKGWIDEFKVSKGDINVENMCNLAHGSLIKLDNNYTGKYKEIANLSHTGIHGHIASKIQNGSRTDKFACHTNYKSWKGINVNLPPLNTTSIREQILFPEGPLIANESRPDSENNGFCLQCHTVEHPVPSMGLFALIEDVSLTAKQDLRRQPLQPQRLIFGNIPANYFGEGLPNEPIKAKKGFKIDNLVLPTKEYVESFNR